MKNKYGFMRFNPLAVSVLLALPVVTHAAGISFTNGSLSSANGVPVVDINKPGANGISHNVYDQLNVGKQGLIFNNSQKGANTTLAGQIAGNGNLAAGTAKVILNEVTSRNSSVLNGMMEVAGDKAHLIIANPNGISCQSCGVINADKFTMTTGKPDMVNGNLKGYSVSGGTITTNGLTTDSPTEILARSIVVNGVINNKRHELSLVAGNNAVDVNGKVIGSVKATGSRNSWSIDVAKLGGMYANKINLVSTEKGVGVRNLGVLVGGPNGIQIDTQGQLINRDATIKSSGVIGIKTNGALENITGKIMSDKTVSIDTSKNTVNNSMGGKILSGADLNISSGAFDNNNGRLAATDTLAMNTNNGRLTNSGKGVNVGIEAGVVVLQTGQLDNSGQIRGYYVGIGSGGVNNRKGVIESAGDVDMRSTGAFNNSGGLIRGGQGHVKIDAGKNTLTNGDTKTVDANSSDSLGIIAGNGGIQISAGDINNQGGQIVSSGNIDLKSSSRINNTNGTVNSENILSAQADSIYNSQSSLSGQNGINIDVGNGDLTNYIAYLSSKEGDVTIKGRNIYNNGGLMTGQNIDITSQGNVENNYALMAAKEKLTINAKYAVNNTNSKGFSSPYGFYLGMPNQEGGMVGKAGVDIKAQSINNNRGRLIAQGGPLTLAIANELYNDHGMLVGGTGASTITAKSINNNYATLYSSGDLSINTGSLSLAGYGSIENNNAEGIIASDANLKMSVGSNFTNDGWIVGKTSASVNIDGSLTNKNTFYSDNLLDVYARTGIWNYKDMVSGKQISLSALAKIYNSANMFSEGKAEILATSIENAGRSAVIGGREGLELITNAISGNGKFVGL